MSSVKIVVIVVWLVFALVGCSEASETAPEPTATLDVVALVSGVVEGTLEARESSNVDLETTGEGTVAVAATVEAAPTAIATAVIADTVVPTRGGSATAFWLPRSGTYTRADGEWKYAMATLVSESASLSAPDGSSGGPFTLPSKGELVTLPSSADGEVTGHLFMECSEPGDLVSVGVGWPGEIMKTEVADVVVGVQFDDMEWQYQLWRAESAPTTLLQVPLNEDHEYVRRLANSRKFSLDLVFDDGSVLQMRWNLPGKLSAPSDAVALCDLMR